MVEKLSQNMTGRRDRGAEAGGDVGVDTGVGTGVGAGVEIAPEAGGN